MGDDVYLEGSAAVFRRATERRVRVRRRRRRRQGVASLVAAVMLLPAGGALAVQELDQWDSLTVSTVAGTGGDASMVVDVEPGADAGQVANDLRAVFRERDWQVEVRTLRGDPTLAGAIVAENGVRLDSSLQAPYSRRVMLSADAGLVQVVVPVGAGELRQALTADGDLCELLGSPAGEVDLLLGSTGVEVRWQDESGAPTDPDERPVVGLIEIGPGVYLGLASRTVEPLPCP